jgi:endonuclease/exonuclease/phosphatase family metal-dependent hydrolase
MPVSMILDRSDPTPNTVRVLTHNIYGTRSGWAARRRVLVDGIRALRPDLLAFQETIVTADYDQAADILGDEFAIVHSAARETDGQGISIASRWPVDEVRELDLNVTSRTGKFACTALLAKVQAPAPIGPVLVVNHLPDWQLDHERERELQAVVVARAIEELLADEDRRVVLAGDLDAEPDAASVRFWTGRQSLGGMSVCYRDAWESAHPGELGHTFTPENGLMNDWDWPFRRIDYLFVRCREHGGPTLGIVACEVAFAEPIDGVWASDHFGVVTDLVAVDDRGRPAAQP